MWHQRVITLAPRRRGFHLVTHDILSQMPEIEHYEVGLCHLLLQHTSASLTLNENADPTVRTDLEATFNRLVPDGASWYRHTLEGPDDMPAHVKSSMMGTSLTLPVTGGRLNLGTWQGIYLCEHREQGGSRRIVVTLHGQLAART